MKLLGLGVALLVMVTGCSLGFLDADQLRELRQDTASVCLSLPTPYGPLRFARTNIVQGNVVCDGNGQTVQSDAQKVGVPLLVVPKVTVGEPTVEPR